MTNSPNPVAFPASTAKKKSVYIIIGVVVGLVIISFIGCMMTVRYWASWKNELSRRMKFKRVGTPDSAVESNERESPETEMEMKQKHQV